MYLFPVKLPTEEINLDFERYYLDLFEMLTITCKKIAASKWYLPGTSGGGSSTEREAAPRTFRDGVGKDFEVSL